MENQDSEVHPGAAPIETANDITGPVARQLRAVRGMSQREFWGAIGVQQAVSSKYENGLRLPNAIKTLVFIRYVAGIEHDLSTVEGAAMLRQLAASKP